MSLKTQMHVVTTELSLLSGSDYVVPILNTPWSRPAQTKPTLMLHDVEWKDNIIQHSV